MVLDPRFKITFHAQVQLIASIKNIIAECCLEFLVKWSSQTSDNNKGKQYTANGDNQSSVKTKKS